MQFAYGIRNIETKEVWRAVSGKTNWRTAGHAKLAWHSSMSYRYNRPAGITTQRFDDQTLFEVFKYGQDEEAQLKRAMLLLERVIYTGALTFDGQPDFEELEADIVAFLAQEQQ